MKPENAFKKLDERIIKALKEFGIAEPTPIQQLAIEPILAGANCLLISETGTGKTLAALLPIFHLWLKEKPKPISMLYISPMKALNRDLLLHLEKWAKILEMEITVRHGDTSPYERKVQQVFPNDMMIVTLETLQPILTGKKIREHLKNVKWVIIDEVHEIVDSKRGVQLALALERLKELCSDFQLIMLSATIGEPEKVSSFFAGGKQVKIIRVTTEKTMEISVINPKPTKQDRKIAEKIFSSLETAARLRTIMEFILNSRSTLTFTNTREFAEILASRIKIVDKKFPVAIHHSSLSKEVRIKTEKEFKEEKLKSIICTSSLQLGVDIGSVDLVLQYMSPREVTQLVQRVGRSGHELKKISKGIIVATNEDDIFESAVIARKALANELEKVSLHKNCLDVLAHQLVGLTLDFGKIELEKAYSLVKRAYPYKDLSRAEFLEVCKQLEKLGLVFLNNYLKKKRRGFQYYFSQLSTIPSLKQYKVFNTLEKSFVGVLDEEFVALHAEPNTTFIVKGEPWRVLSVEGDKVLVEPSNDVEAAIPAWEGELIPVSFEVAQEVGKLRGIIENMLKQKREEEVVEWIRENYPVDKNCAKDMVKIIKKQIKFGVVPTDKLILIEDFENLVILHTCFGTKVNETIGRFLTSILSSRLGSVGLRTDSYRIMLYFQQKNLKAIEEALYATNPENFKLYLEVNLSRSELFEWKFVHVAKRFGAIASDAEYGKVSIKKIIEEYAGSPIYKETLRELEIEKFDIEKSIEILRKIQNKEISVVFKPGLSPLGKIGVKYKYAEIIGPIKPEKEIFELFKQRLLSTRIKLVCMNCGEWEQTYVVGKISREISCRKCGAKLLAAVKPSSKVLKIVKKGLKGNLTQGEKKIYERLMQKADLYLVYKLKAIKVLAGRGIGPKTARRILARFHKNEEELLKDVLEAERSFVRTRKYWSV
jgi:ATP-dependent Lhr-like helicase